MKLSETEIEAVRAALPAVGEYVALVGMDKGLKDYTKDEALRLVAVAYSAVISYARDNADLNDPKATHF